MKKAMALILSLILISTILVGCRSEDNTTQNTNEIKVDQQTEVVTKTKIDHVETNERSEEDHEKLKLDGAISKVSTSKSNANDTTVFDDDQSIETLNTVLTSAVRVNGIVDMADPEFDVELVYANENKQHFHLWLGEIGEQSTFMNTDDTHTIYTVPKEMTGKLIDLIER